MVETPQYDSAATRLLTFVQRARAILPKNWNQAQGWAHILNCQVNDKKAILEGISAILGLIQDCRQAVSTLDIEQSLYFETLDEIEASFAKIGLEKPWSIFAGSWNDATVRSLRFVEAQLRTATQEVRLPTNDLTEVLKDISDVEDRIRSSTGDPKLRQVILDHLSAIRAAINAYEVGGICYLERVVSRSLGMVYFQQDLFQTDTDSKNKFVEILRKCGKLVAIARSTLGLLPAAADAKDAFGRLVTGS